MECANSYDFFSNSIFSVSASFSEFVSVFVFFSLYVHVLLYRVVGCVLHCSISTMDVSMVLSEYLVCRVGCLI